MVVPKNAAILDVGCGGGRTVQRFATVAPEGKVFGLDYSAVSVAASRDTNAQEIGAGRLQIEQGQRRTSQAGMTGIRREMQLDLAKEIVQTL